MQIPRITVITLGVRDLAESTAFYRAVLATPPNTQHEGVTFIELPGMWLSLFPLENLAADIAPDIPANPVTFGGFTLAHNARSKDEVHAIIERARAAGARIVKEPQDTFWGGYGAYFVSPDNHYWEVVYGAMFRFDEQGALIP